MKKLISVAFLKLDRLSEIIVNILTIKGVKHLQTKQKGHEQTAIKHPINLDTLFQILFINKDAALPEHFRFSWKEKSMEIASR